MPEMEGIETIHDLRREFPEAKIIAMSGRDPLANLDVFEVARQVGAAKTFNKPFKFEDLIAAVRELSGAKDSEFRTARDDRPIGRDRRQSTLTVAPRMHSADLRDRHSP